MTAGVRTADDFDHLVTWSTSPLASAAARCIYQFRDVVGQTWFGGQRLTRPEPSSFGDSLAQLERFLHDVIERNGSEWPRPFLFGVDQGAVLALSLAAVTPHLISGVIAIGGRLPNFSVPALLQSVPSNQPVLLIDDPDHVDVPRAEIKETVARLTELGCDVTAVTLASSRRLGAAVADALSAWLASRVELCPERDKGQFPSGVNKVRNISACIV